METDHQKEQMIAHIETMRYSENPFEQLMGVQLYNAYQNGNPNHFWHMLRVHTHGYEEALIKLNQKWTEIVGE
jgi:hypothetical protein